jgi:hypothetical protein
MRVVRPDRPRAVVAESVLREASISDFQPILPARTPAGRTSPQNGGDQMNGDASRVSAVLGIW